MPPDAPLLLAAALTLAAALAAGTAWLLRGAGIAGGRPAAAIVGGLLAGVLLGPAVLGQAAPDLHARLFRGGTAERQELRQAMSRHAADRAAFTVTGATPGTLAELFTQHNAERAPLERSLRLAIAQHRRELLAATAAIVALALLLTSLTGRPPIATVPGTTIAATALLVEVAFIGATASLLFGAPLNLAIGAGAAGAAGSALAGRPLRWVPYAGRGGLVRSAAPAMFIAAMLIVVALSRGTLRLLPAVILAAPLLGWALRPVVGRLGRAPARFARGVLVWIALPTAAAMVAVHIEWDLIGSETRAGLVVPFLVLLSGNAAFVGLWLGGRLSAPIWIRPRSIGRLLDWQAAGFGPTQVCVVLAMLGGGLADPLTPIGSGVLAGLLLSAAIGETLLGWMHHALQEAAQDATSSD